MNTRTRLLLVAMVIVALFWLGDMAYRNLIEGPAAQRQRELTRLDQQINQAREIIISSADAADQLALLERVSLPYDQELARARYQDWLLDLVQQSELAGAVVDAGNPTSVKIKDRDTRRQKEVYSRYGFSIRGRGNLHQVVDFLHRFYQGGHLHKIHTVSLNPVSGGRLVDFNATIEAIGLARCERKEDLSREPYRRLVSKNLDDYRTIARRNLFARHGDATLAKITLTAITVAADGTVEAWFSTDGEPTSVLHRGGQIEVDAHQIEIVDVLTDQVIIDVDGKVLAIRAGQSVQDAEQSLLPSRGGQMSGPEGGADADRGRFSPITAPNG